MLGVREKYCPHTSASAQRSRNYWSFHLRTGWFPREERLIIWLVSVWEIRWVKFDKGVGSLHARWRDPHMASQFPILCIPDWTRESTFSGSAPTTLDSGGKESMRPSDQSYIHPFSFTREFCLGSGEHPACSCVFFSLSQRGEGVCIRIQAPKPVCRSLTVHLQCPGIAHLLRSPGLTPTAHARLSLCER